MRSSEKTSPHVTYRRAILAFMFFTGICSIGYEVLLERAVVILVGSSSVAMGLIISTFILGYLSSFYFGKLADRIDSKKRLVEYLAILECLICLALVLVVPVTRYSLVIADYLSYLIFFYYLDFYYVLLITVGLIALLVPLLMGAEIPIAMKLMAWGGVPDRKNTFEDVGKISGVVFTFDSLGAGFGGLVTALLLIPNLGRTYTAVLLGLVTLSSGMAFLLIHSWYEERRRSMGHSTAYGRGNGDGTGKVPQDKKRGTVDRALPRSVQGAARGTVRGPHTRVGPRKGGGRSTRGTGRAGGPRRSLPMVIGVVVLIAVLVVLANLHDVEEASYRRFYGGNVLYHSDSQYQEIVITEREPEGITLYLNGQLQISEMDDAMYHEFLVHPALLAHPFPKRVLVIGGGDGGAVEEILKHDTVEEVVFIELDLEVIEVCDRYLTSINHGCFDDPRVDVRIEDGRIFVRDYEGEPFDVVIGDLPDPDTEAVAMLYTVEFFGDVRDILAFDGIFALQAASWFEYPYITMSISKTLKEVFPDVELYLSNVWTFGPWSFAVASQSYNLGELEIGLIDHFLSDLGIETEYYNGYTHRASFLLADNPYLESGLDRARVSNMDRPVLQNPWE